MTENTFKVRKAEIKDIVQVAYPRYHGRKYEITFTDTITIYNTNWSGGTKNSYTAVASNGKSVRFSAPAPWVNQVEGQKMAVPLDALIVKHSVFCGKDMGITIYAHPCHMPKWLPAQV